MEAINISGLLVLIISIIIGICIAISTYFITRSFNTISDVPVKLANIAAAITLVETKNKAAYRALDERFSGQINGISKRLEMLEHDAKAAQQYPPNSPKR